MLYNLFVSSWLVAGCVVIHAIGVMTMFRWLERTRAVADPRFWPPIWLLIRLAAWLVSTAVLLSGCQAAPSPSTVHSLQAISITVRSIENGKSSLISPNPSLVLSRLELKHSLRRGLGPG